MLSKQGKLLIGTEYIQHCSKLEPASLLFIVNVMIDSHALNWNKLINKNNKKHQIQFQLGALPVHCDSIITNIDKFVIKGFSRFDFISFINFFRFFL